MATRVTTTTPRPAASIDCIRHPQLATAIAKRAIVDDDVVWATNSTASLAAE